MRKKLLLNSLASSKTLASAGFIQAAASAALPIRLEDHSSVLYQPQRNRSRALRLRHRAAVDNQCLLSGVQPCSHKPYGAEAMRQQC